MLVSRQLPPSSIFGSLCRNLSVPCALGHCFAIGNPSRNKNRLCSKTCGMEMNAKREKIKKKIENSNRKVPKERKNI